MLRVGRKFPLLVLLLRTWALSKHKVLHVVIYLGAVVEKLR